MWARWLIPARFRLEWGSSEFLSPVIPTGTDRRKAMICGVEGPALSEVEGDLLVLRHDWYS